ncbi:uncharacterized protein [Watersipora subatra]|uniref:uncharacterized protein n=1 Tax=Watersipora subatra TaxID=2589382 RepID=UPI00355ADFBA
MAYTYVLAIIFTTVSLGSTQDKPPTESCIVPLLDVVTQDNSKRMCDMMDEFSQCYVDTDVNRNNLRSMETTLQTMVAIMELFEQENCDLNEEFNNMCRDDFFDCLDLVTEGQGSDLTVTCNQQAYLAFLECVNLELEVGEGPCYFADWHERIVNSTRALLCTRNVEIPSVEMKDLNDDGSIDDIDGDLGSSSGYCDAGGIRYHVFRNCTVFRMEWLGMNIVFKPQRVAPATLFDVSICGLNHENLVSC